MKTKLRKAEEAVLKAAERIVPEVREECWYTHQAALEPLAKAIRKLRKARAEARK